MVQCLLQDLLYPVFTLYRRLDGQGIPPDKGEREVVEAGFVVGYRVASFDPHRVRDRPSQKVAASLVYRGESSCIIIIIIGLGRC